MAGVVLEHLEKPKSPRLDPGNSGRSEDGSMLRQEAGHLGAAQVSLQYSWTSARDLGEIVAGTCLCLKGREELVLPHSSSVLPDTRVPWDPHGHGGLRGSWSLLLGLSLLTWPCPMCVPEGDSFLVVPLLPSVLPAHDLSWTQEGELGASLPISQTRGSLPMDRAEIPGGQVGTGFSLCKPKILFHSCYVM